MITENNVASAGKLENRTSPINRILRKRIILAGLIIGDLISIGTAFFLAYQIRFETLVYYSNFSAEQYRQLVLVMLPAWLLLIASFQGYSFNILFGGLQEYSRVFNALSLGAILIMMVSFFTRNDSVISRGWLVISWLLAVTLTLTMRFLFRRIVYSLRRSGFLLAPAIVVGINEEGKALADQLKNWETSGFEIKGFVDPDESSRNMVLKPFIVLGGLKDLEEIIVKEHIEEIIVAPTALNREQLLEIYQIGTRKPDITVRLSSGLFEILSTRVRVKEFAYVPLLQLSDTRITGIDMVLKTLIDYMLTIPGLILISPLLLVIAVAVKLDSHGSILYRRRVMGLNGTEFDAYKFRSMYTNGSEIIETNSDMREELEINFKLKDDPRVTRVGKFLRKWSLDELPQLFNVILGQMSLIGPRMISPPEMEKYGKWGMNLLTVKPGITGMWQISGRSDLSYEDRIRMDMNYIRNWTLWLDIFILLHTPSAVVQKKGAY